MTVIYNPIVRKGTFRVDYKDYKRLYETIGEAEAKYCLIEEFKLFENKSHTQKNLILKSIKVWTIKKVIRQNDLKVKK
jgi:hypothetical protein